MSDPVLTGRCYCGAVRLEASAAPRVVSYCHCADCRRWTGAPVAAFAAFSPSALTGLDLDAGRSHAPGVTRWICAACGSPLASHFVYLQDQIFVPLG
ncbi:MAG: GFA family protein, partial [Pseudomonadota bacterium]